METEEKYYLRTDRMSVVDGPWISETFKTTKKWGREVTTTFGTSEVKRTAWASEEEATLAAERILFRFLSGTVDLIEKAKAGTLTREDLEEHDTLNLDLVCVRRTVERFPTSEVVTITTSWKKAEPFARIRSKLNAGRMTTEPQWLGSSQPVTETRIPSVQAR